MKTIEEKTIEEKTIEEKEAYLRNINFFVGGLTDEMIEYYFELYYNDRTN